MPGNRPEVEEMKSLIRSMKQFLTSEDGPTAVEYAVLVALIILVAIAGITILGQNVNQLFNDAAGSLPAAGGGG